MSAFQIAPYILVLTGIGLLIALVAWLPLALKKLPLSLPIICMALGAGLFSLPQIALRPLPLSYPEITERFTEVVVIIALMGAGLKIDRMFHLRRWQVTWRLLIITMPLCIGAIALLAAWAGLPWMVALLLGAGLTTALPSGSLRAAEAAEGVPAAVTQETSPTLSDQFFKVEWTVTPGRQGDSRITGYVYNQYGEAAENVQLRISEIDGSGRVISSVTRPVFGAVPGEDAPIRGRCEEAVLSGRGDSFASGGDRT